MTAPDPFPAPAVTPEREPALESRCCFRRVGASDADAGKAQLESPPFDLYR